MVNTQEGRLTLPTLASQNAACLAHSQATPLPTLISCFLLHVETGNEPEYETYYLSAQGSK